MSAGKPTTALELAARFTGLHEVAGVVANPQVLAMLTLVDTSVTDDATPWCSAFVAYVAWLLGLPQSRSLAARSWLSVGWPIALDKAEPGFDVVVLNRANGSADPSKAGPGHVGFFHSLFPDRVLILGGNQSDAVSLGIFRRDAVLGVRRLYV